ncbi:DUF1427 family protein [Enterobacter sp.]|uniref:DUF1427 family protein n=1 Tax=Enterobacter sp. TaxID=42895 RepID=UPI00296E283A|nr:DUF1427 family protein [Enterobacter sp.]
MSPLLLSLGAGVLIGLIYALFNVRSPAPPAVALIGLLGMILGSQLASRFITPEPTAQISFHHPIVSAIAKKAE